MPQSNQKDYNNAGRGDEKGSGLTMIQLSSEEDEEEMDAQQEQKQQQG